MSLTHYPLMSCYTPCMRAYLAVFNHLLYSLQFWQVSAWRFHCLKSSLDNRNFYFLPLASPKFVEYIVDFASHVQINSLLHLSTESRLIINNIMTLLRSSVICHIIFQIKSIINGCCSFWSFKNKVKFFQKKKKKTEKSIFTAWSLNPNINLVSNIISGLEQ